MSFLTSNKDIKVEKTLDDYLKEEDKKAEAEAHRQKILSKTIKIKRNDKCPCGSGKKFKRCCINKIKNRQPLSAFRQPDSKGPPAM